MTSPTAVPALQGDLLRPPSTRVERAPPHRLFVSIEPIHPGADLEIRRLRPGVWPADVTRGKGRNGSSFSKYAIRNRGRVESQL